MGAPKKAKSKSTQVSVRLEPQDYEDFNKLCHMEFSQMATVGRELLLEWIDKNRKKLK